MQDKILISNLLDFYGCLLTENQQNICNLYFNEDYSLSEIAEIEKKSRNAVFDVIKRSEQILLNFEEKIKCYHSYKNRITIYEEIKAKQIKDINKLIDKLIDTENKEDKNE